MSHQQVSPAWASTAVGELLCGRRQEASFSRYQGGVLSQRA